MSLSYLYLLSYSKNPDPYFLKSSSYYDSTVYKGFNFDFICFFIVFLLYGHYNAVDIKTPQHNPDEPVNSLQRELASA